MCRKYQGIAVMTLLLACGIAGGKTRLIDPTYDFGVVRELDGSVTGHAHVVNDGPDTTYVRDVRPSCGCTGAQYFQDPIAPGDTTEISFTYNPVGRPGTISKTVKIYIGDSDERHIVKLTGRVVGSRETLRWKYPVDCGWMALSDSVVDLGQIRENSGRHAFLRIVNLTTDTIAPKFSNTSKALSIDVTPERLLPGDLGTLGIYLNTKFTDTLGNVDYRVPIWADGDTVRTEVSIRARIVSETDSLALLQNNLQARF